MPGIKVSRESIRLFLVEREIAAGGFTGRDLADFARLHGLHPVTFRRRVNRLLGNDTTFRGFHDLGKRTPALTTEDLVTLCETLQEAPLTPPTVVVANLNLAREAQGLPPIPRRTAYGLVQTYSLGLPTDRMDPLSWLTHAKVSVSPSYDLAMTRTSLDTHFNWSGLATPYGVSITKTLEKAETVFRSLYPTAQPHAWYETLRPRSPCLSAFLGSSPTERAPALAARFTFELQALWLAEARDLLLDQLRRRRRSLLQSINARQLPKSRELLLEQRARGKDLVRAHLAHPTKATRKALLRWAAEPDTIEEHARAVLRVDLKLAPRYEKVQTTLSRLTRGFHSEEVVAHTPRALLLLQLARGEMAWTQLPTREQTCLGKNRRLLNHVSPPMQEGLAKTLLTDRVMDALARGKITLTRSWVHQDLGTRAAAVVLPADPESWPLPRSTLDALLSGTYHVDLTPLEELRKAPPADEGDEGDEWVPQVGYQEMAREIHGAILEHHPDWFLVHRRKLQEFWDGSFRMEYTEEEFTHRLLLAIGFLGRNLRIRDDPAFVSFRHFLRRYVTPDTLEAELRFYHETLAEVLGRRIQALLVDTVGREGRSTHPLSSWHPRYLLQGFADLRGIGEYRLPIYSLSISSTDTEVMNALDIVARARRVVGENIRIYGGNGHTISRVSAGLLFGVFGVVSAGHIVHSPAPLSAGARRRLVDNLESLNKVLLLLRQKPELGRLFATRSHVYVGGVNVRPLVDHVGGEVIRAMEATGYDWRTAQPHIESSNRLKRLVTEAFGGTARLDYHRQKLALLAGEVILVMAALRARLHREEPEGFSLATGLEDLLLFKPT